MEVLAPSRKPPEFPTHLSVNAYEGQAPDPFGMVRSIDVSDF